MNLDNTRTIRHAVQSFRLFMEDATGRPSSSIIYPNKLIYFFLKSYRNRVSFEDISSKVGYDLNLEMTLPCVELEKVDMVECPCAPSSGCYFMKSKYPLPKILNGIPNSVTLLKQHSSQDSYGVFTYVDWYNFEDKINSRFKAQAIQPYFTMKNIQSNRHLYIYANMEKYPNISKVAVAAVFNDPIDVAAFPICGKVKDVVCNPLEEEFIIEDEIQSKVFELTFNTLASLRNFSRGVDNLNNDSNDTVGQVRKD